MHTAPAFSMIGGAPTRQHTIAIVQNSQTFFDFRLLFTLFFAILTRTPNQSKAPSFFNNSGTEREPQQRLWSAMVGSTAKGGAYEPVHKDSPHLVAGATYLLDREDNF